jgi:hypothetical protein
MGKKNWNNFHESRIITWLIEGGKNLWMLSMIKSLTVKSYLFSKFQIEDFFIISIIHLYIKKFQCSSTQMNEIVACIGLLLLKLLVMSNKHGIESSCSLYSQDRIENTTKKKYKGDPMGIKIQNKYSTWHKLSSLPI